MAAHGADGGTGSARRRRERRFRSWLRHEQQSIAAFLATVTHHSFDKVGTASGVLRNRKTATRTGKGEESEMKCTAKFQKTPPPQAAATVYYPMTDDEGGEQSAGVRPALLEEGRPQGKLERHAGIGYEIVQNFDVPVPQMVEQLPNNVQFFAALSPVPKQVIAVPKILPHDVPPRRLCRDTQLAEQLVEVPTILTPSFLRMLQNVDIPVPHGGRGASGGLQGFLPGHVEQTVDIPAPRSGVRRLQGFLPEQSSTATSSSSSLERISERNVEQNVDSRCFGGGLPDFRPGLSSSSSSHDPARVPKALDKPGEGGFFALFSKLKKARHNLRARGRHCLRTRAHGRRLLMTRPWCLRRRRRSPRTSLSSTCSTMGVGGRCEWVPVHQRYCWWLAAADGSQVGHTIWRPPWLIGSGPW